MDRRLKQQIDDLARIAGAKFVPNEPSNPLSAEERATAALEIAKPLSEHLAIDISVHSMLHWEIRKAITSAEEAARADEREQCAVIADKMDKRAVDEEGGPWGSGYVVGYFEATESIAQAIRSRNKEGGE